MYLDPDEHETYDVIFEPQDITNYVNVGMLTKVSDTSARILKWDVVQWLNDNASDDNEMPLFAFRNHVYIFNDYDNLGSNIKVNVTVKFYRKEHAVLFKLTFG